MLDKKRPSGDVSIDRRAANCGIMLDHLCMKPLSFNCQGEA